MKPLNQQETSVFLKVATVTETSEESGVTIAHRGFCPDGTSFVLIHSKNGSAMLFIS